MTTHPSPATLADIRSFLDAIGNPNVIARPYLSDTTAEELFAESHGRLFVTHRPGRDPYDFHATKFATHYISSLVRGDLAVTNRFNYFNAVKLILRDKVDAIANAMSDADRCVHFNGYDYEFGEVGAYSVIRPAMWSSADGDRHICLTTRLRTTYRDPSAPGCYLICFEDGLSFWSSDVELDFLCWEDFFARRLRVTDVLITCLNGYPLPHDPS